jgi:hypothetical protein
MFNFIRAALAAAILLTTTYAWSQITPYSQDFEAMDPTSAIELGGSFVGDPAGDGWRVFGNVFDSAGIYKFGYGPNPAPNSTADGVPDAFSALVVGEGGPSQGEIVLSVFSDYECCQPPPAPQGHLNGTDIVESNVFQEFIPDAGNIGQNWAFSFDYKRGNIEGSSTALAFIKTIDLVGGTFELVDLVTFETDSGDNTWQRSCVELTIRADLVGQAFQVGFLNNASNFEGSGIFYDNVVLEQGTCDGGGTDTDGDGVDDSIDNCTLAANPAQRDTDGDGHGNFCDGDFNQDCVVNPIDLGAFRAAFFGTDPDFDLNGDGVVNPIDLGLFRALFFGVPGPSPQGSLCNP